MTKTPISAIFVLFAFLLPARPSRYEINLTFNALGRSSIYQ